MAKTARPLTTITPEETIVSKIFLIRNQKVMLDRDLAEMYCVETRVLNQSVKRNIDRFPPDFMFQLSQEEFDNLISHNATSNWGGVRKLPFAFTEQGVAMLSGVLNSPVAIQAHIQIIRVFTKMRQMLSDHNEILRQLEQLETDVNKNKENIAVIFEALKKLLAPAPNLPRKRIGFKPDF